MTDKLQGFMVVFDQKYRDDEVQALRSAILSLRGVASVEALKEGAGAYAEVAVARRYCTLAQARICDLLLLLEKEALK